jgi:hypothetical protein
LSIRPSTCFSKEGLARPLRLLHVDGPWGSDPGSVMPNLSWLRSLLRGSSYGGNSPQSRAEA